MDLDALRDFVAVIEAGGVTSGAARRGAPKQTVSRRLLALETMLGARLFDRSNRALRLTPEGQLLQERARRLLADFDETRRLLADRASAPAGLVRLSAPVLLGQTLLGRLAARVLARHPEITLEIVLSDRRVDLIEHGFDVAIRVGRHDDSALVSRVFARASTIVVAAPSAIAQHPRVRSPRDLARVPCILFGETTGAGAAWTLQRGESTQKIKVAGRLAASSLQLCFDAACAGGGFASVPAYIAADAISTGALRRVLPTWRTGEVDMRILYPSRRLMSPRLRAFIDLAVDTLSETDFGSNAARD
ncbi:MAG: LysR family transcriptional regulator [Alphaproteobacteria bacterium]|nr:LysR family transcriptional regulator [Alphaproteobacteria bacterium]